MDMHQLSAMVEQKLRSLDQQLEDLRQVQAQADAEQQPTLAADIAALQQIRKKLLKSHEIARKAHDLRQTNNDSGRATERLLGLVMMIISGIAALAIVAYLLLTA